MPFTVLVIKPINDKLFGKADTLALDDKVAAQDQSVKQLIDQWAKLHLIRTAITGVGAVLAIWAALDKREAGSGSLAFSTGANRLG